MNELEKILKNKKINYSKLIKYGFKKVEDNYIYEKILLNKFNCIIDINNDKVTSKIIDLKTSEEYLPFNIPFITGEYVGLIRNEYQKVLMDIVEKCCDEEVFRNKQTLEVINYVNDKYQEKLEFLWKDEDKCAVFRHQNPKKWYGVVMSISGEKLGVKDKKEIEIIVLKIEPLVLEQLVDNDKYFRGYHMNKKHWLTIILDGRIPLSKVLQFVNNSYNITK